MSAEFDKLTVSPSHEVMVFVAPPAMKLVDHISACVELSKLKFSAGADDEEGFRREGAAGPEADEVKLPILANLGEQKDKAMW